MIFVVVAVVDFFLAVVDVVVVVHVLSSAVSLQLLAVAGDAFVPGIEVVVVAVDIEP